MRIAVVGAGIVGLATAYEFAGRGAAVTVYERDEAGGHHAMLPGPLP